MLRTGSAARIVTMAAGTALTVALAGMLCCMQPSTGCAYGATASITTKAFTGSKAKKSVVKTGKVNAKQLKKALKVGKTRTKKLKSGTTAATMTLKGTAKKSYAINYRAYVTGYGWLGWVSNGKKTGTAVKGKKLKKLQFKIVKKGKKAKAVANSFYIKNANFFKLTKDLSTDLEIASIASAQKGSSADAKFGNCFKWVVNNISYAGTGRAAVAAGKLSASRLKTEGKAAFNSRKGDCYTYTAASYYLGTYLGFTMKAISGFQKSGGSWAPFSWAEKVVDSSYIYDAVSQYSYDPKFTGTVTVGGVQYDFRASGITMAFVKDHPSTYKTPTLSYSASA